MSRAAQEVERAVKEMRASDEKEQKRKVPPARPVSEFLAGAQEQPPPADESGTGDQTQTEDHLDVNSAAPEVQQQEQENTMAKKTRRVRKSAGASAPRARKRASKPTAVKNGNGLDPMAGINKKPKNKILFINRAGALALVERLLRDAKGLSTDEQYEANRLLARIDARG